jgi:hypothetical protein
VPEVVPTGTGTTVANPAPATTTTPTTPAPTTTTTTTPATPTTTTTKAPTTTTTPPATTKAPVAPTKKVKRQTKITKIQITRAKAAARKAKVQRAHAASAGASVLVKGEVADPDAATTVTLQVKRGSRYVRVSSAKVALDDDGDWAFLSPAQAAGTYRVVVKAGRTTISKRFSVDG